MRKPPRHLTGHHHISPGQQEEAWKTKEEEAGREGLTIRQMILLTKLTPPAEKEGRRRRDLKAPKARDGAKQSKLGWKNCS